MERKNGPVVLALSRQGVAVYPKHDPAWRDNMRKGAYIVREPEGADPGIIIAATGSEIGLALDAADLLPDRKIRVVSISSYKLLMQQPDEFRQRVLPKGTRTIVAEAGVPACWEGVASSRKDIFGIDRFGESGPGDEVAEHLGYTPKGLAALIENNQER
jgi:transketolase